MITEFSNCIPISLALKMLSAVFNKTDYKDSVDYVFEKTNVIVKVESTDLVEPLLTVEYSAMAKISISPIGFTFDKTGQELTLCDSDFNQVVIPLEYNPSCPWRQLVSGLTDNEISIVHKLAELIKTIESCGMDVA